MASNRVVSPSRMAADAGLTITGVTVTSAVELVSRTEAWMTVTPNVRPRTSPRESMVATPESTVAQAMPKSRRVSPLALRTIAFSRTVSRKRRAVTWGLIKIRVGGMTKSSASVDAARVDAWILVTPSSTPVTRPDASIRATAGDELLHTILAPVSGTPANPVTVATNRIVSPRPIEAPDGDIATWNSVTGSEVSRQVDRARVPTMTVIKETAGRRHRGVRSLARRSKALGS